MKRVVVANLDSNPLVAGEGIRKLREANIAVTTGILEKEGRELNKRFFTFMEKKRPYIILKWAQTADGFVARENYDSKWISNTQARQLVHRWRTEEDAVLVGRKTAMHDDPKLNVRDWTGRNPVRVVTDRFLKLSDRLQLFDGTQKTLRYNVLKHEEHNNLSLVRIDETDFFTNLVNDLYKKKIQSIIVEGGSETLNFFIASQVWDEARIFVSEKTFGNGVAAPILTGTVAREEKILNNRLTWMYP